MCVCVLHVVLSTVHLPAPVLDSLNSKDICAVILVFYS